MDKKRHINYKTWLGVGIIALTTSLGLNLLDGASASAASCTPDSPYSCIEVNFGEVIGTTTTQPGTFTKGRLSFKLPVSLTMNRIKNYTVKAYGSNNGALTSGTNTIPSILSDTAWADLGKSHSEWGMRYNEGADDAVLKNYSKIPANEADALLIASNQSTASLTGSESREYTLGFGVVVDGDTAAGNYTNEITIAVVATPLESSIFNIKYMQDMTADICAATTKPASTATGTDTDGSHRGDTNYVPETTLIDKRDNKSYLIRKLADGNCWMAQNLELDILGNSLVGQQSSAKQGYYNGTTQSGVNSSNTNEAIAVTADNYFGDIVTGEFKLTAEDTDLWSVTEWTPEIFKQKYVSSGIAPYARVYATMIGTQTAPDYARGWANSGQDGLRSYSYNASNPEWNYSILDALGNDTVSSTFKNSATGEPYERRGNLYNWTAATLGSGLGTRQDSQEVESQDSICSKGWQLPVNGAEGDFTAALNTITDKSFTKLLRVYGLPSFEGTSIASYNQLSQWPLQFPKSNFYDRSNGPISNGLTSSGNWWTSTSASDVRKYYLNSRINVVYVQGKGYPGYGFAIRCVAR